MNGKDRNTDRDALQKENFHLREELEKTRKDLKESRQKEQVFFESSRDGIIFVSRTGFVLDVNTAFTAITGIARDDIIGRHSFKLVREFVTLKQIPMVMELLKRLFAGKVIEPYTLEYRNQVLEIGTPYSPVDNPLVVGVIRDITSRVKAETDRERLIANLKDALDQVKTLRGMLPICASCKKIRDDSGYWHQVEEYVRDRTDASFTHSICPECMTRLYPELSRNKDTDPTE